MLKGVDKTHPTRKGLLRAVNQNIVSIITYHFLTERILKKKLTFEENSYFFCKSVGMKGTLSSCCCRLLELEKKIVLVV